MQIIETSPWEHEITCSKCGSRLAIEMGDVLHARFGGIGYAGEPGEKKYFAECPICESDLMIPNDKITPKVERMAREWHSNGSHNRAL